MGILLSGTFKLTPQAVTLPTAPQFNNPSTPIMVRFSTATGIPQTDTDSNVYPHSFALRFNNGYSGHTDITGHSAPGFPVRSAAELLEYLRAIAGSPPGAASPTSVEKFLGSHPAVLAYAQIPNSLPTSYATEAYFAVAAFKFTNAEGVIKFGRYIILPDAGLSHLEGREAALKTTSYLWDELSERIANGPISFTLRAQIAADGDVTDNSTVQWPQDHPIIDLGTLTLEAVVPGDDIDVEFNPIPGVQGIEPSGDPLLELHHLRSCA